LHVKKPCQKGKCYDNKYEQNDALPAFKHRATKIGKPGGFDLFMWT
jgi:hypothetical protein